MPADKRKPNGILLDLDGTLYEYGPAHDAGLKEFCLTLERDLGVTQNQGSELYSEAGRRVKSRLGHNAASHSRLLYSQTVLDMLELGAALDSIQNLANAYWHGFFSKMSLRPGAFDFFKQVQSLQIPVCIVTDLTLDIQLKKLMALSLDGLFSALVTSEETGADKPDPANFLLAMEKLGLRSDSFVWMIGDSIEKDGIGSLQALNCEAFVIKSGLATKSINEFETFFELIDRLRTLA